MSGVARGQYRSPVRPAERLALPQHGRPDPHGHLSPASLLALQRTIGNRAAAALVVQRDIAAAERELARRFASPEDKRLLQRRNALGAEFAMMNEADAGEVAGRLLQPTNADAMAAGMQRLHRGTRFRLLKILFARVGHLGAENLHAALTAGTADGTRLSSRFAELVPDSGRRKALLASLAAQFEAAHQPTADKPLWVTLSSANFRTSGGVSTDNNAAAAANYSRLGLDTGSGRNRMELRGDVAGHKAGVTYDFKRTLQQASWSAVTDTWELHRSLPAGSPDDAHDNDEDLNPDSGHIYVLDSPGPYFDDPAYGHRGAQHYVYMATFVEWVEARTGSGGWQKVSDDFYWHSVSTLVKVNGTWQRDPQGANEIAEDPLPIVSPDGKAP